MEVKVRAKAPQRAIQFDGSNAEECIAFVGDDCLSIKVHPNDPEALKLYFWDADPCKVVKGMWLVKAVYEGNEIQMLSDPSFRELYDVEESK